jgi:hypothetical protein
LLDERDVAEFAAGEFGRGLGVGAAGSVILRGHLEVGFEFGIQVGAIVVAVAITIAEEVHWSSFENYS